MGVPRRRSSGCGQRAPFRTCFALPDELRPRLAKGHGQEQRVAGDFADTMLALPGCGAIRSTANDMLKYVAANLGLKPSPLQPLMEKTHAIGIPHAFDEADLAMPCWVYHRQGAELITHGGSTAGHKAFIGFEQAARRGVVLLSNREDNNEQAMLPLGLYLLHPPATHPPAVSVAPEILDYLICSAPACLGRLHRLDPLVTPARAPA